MDLRDIQSIEMKGGGIAGPIVKVRITAVNGAQASFAGHESGRKIEVTEKDGISVCKVVFVDFAPAGWEDEV